MTVEEMLAERPSAEVTLDMNELQSLLQVLNPRIYARHVPYIESYPDDEPAHIRCACTACGQVFASSHKRIKDISCCPECGTPVTPKRWGSGYKHVNAFLYTHLIRGRGRKVWARSYRVEQMLSEDGLTIETTPVSIYHFDDGVAEKFRWKLYDAYWERVTSKRFTGDTWYKNQMYQEAHPEFIGRIDRETIDGSCLEYSQLDRAMHYALPVIAYLRMYIKYPAVEYLWKTGCERLLVDHLCYQDGYIRQAVNLRAKDFKALFRGADRQEMKIFPQLTAKEIVWFHGLYQLDVIHADPEGVNWARTRMNFRREIGVVEEETVLYRYIKRQAKRSGLSDRSCLGDYRDYLRQLEEIGGGEPYPHDLQTAHRRLSARLRKTKNKDLQGMFRARRKLWSWAAWRYQGMLIRPIDSVDEITLEGERQDNCVASYANRHASGRTAIFVLRKTTAPKTNWHTVELDPETLRVKQCRGYHNADAAPEAKAFIKAWMQYLQEQKGRKTA